LGGDRPFILKSFDGTAADFAANLDYWLRDSEGRQLPLSKGLSIRVIKDVNTLVSAFRQGEIDILNVPLALFNNVSITRSTK